MKDGVLAAGWTTQRSFDASRWSSVDPGIRGDMAYVWGEGCSSADAHLLHGALFGGDWDPMEKRMRPSLAEDLVKRGYDLSTLKFSVSKKQATQREQAASRGVDDGL